MFQLDDSPSYWYPVPVELVDANGRTRKFSFDAEFARLEQDEITEMFRPRDEGEPPLRDADVVERVFRGWKPDQVKDVDGSPLEVNDTNREKLLNRFPVPRSIVKAYLKSIGVEGKAKN
jgi:hypothetical protein